MIGKLSGTIDSVAGSHLIIDVNGVGYVVACSARTLRQIGTIGAAASLRIETQVREDAISLFGFANSDEQEWFRLLTTVQGVGAKVALAILGALSPDQLRNVIAAQDKAALTQADGVGPKLALRLVTELKDKVPTFIGSATASRATGDDRPDGTGADESLLPTSAASDAVSALVNLGYRRAEAFAAVAAAGRNNPAAPLHDLIRHSLTELGSGRRPT